jgi:hypothetical protein
MEPLKIVLFAANPFGDLKLDEEIRRIEEKLDDSDLRKIDLVAVPATRPGDLLDKLNQHRPKIVQFSGHGVRKGQGAANADGLTRHAAALDAQNCRDFPATAGDGAHDAEGEIVLIGEDGKPKLVGKKGLVSLFRLRHDVVQIVVLNACYTRSQAEAIAEYVDCVIGTDRSIQDEAARIFAARLYRSLAAGFPIATAFEEAKIELELQGFEDQASIPQLWTRATVDPTQVFLLPDGEARTGEAQAVQDLHNQPSNSAMGSPHRVEPHHEAGAGATTALETARHDHGREPSTGAGTAIHAERATRGTLGQGTFRHQEDERRPRFGRAVWALSGFALVVGGIAWLGWGNGPSLRETTKPDVKIANNPDAADSVSSRRKSLKPVGEPIAPQTQQPAPEQPKQEARGGEPVRAERAQTTLAHGPSSVAKPIVDKDKANGLMLDRLAPPASRSNPVASLDEWAMVRRPFRPLFNGVDLTGWKLYSGRVDSWSVSGHVLTTTGEPHGWLFTEKEYGDFDLKFDYRLSPNANTGVAIHAPRLANAAFAGLEIQILDDAGTEFVNLAPEQRTGAIYKLVPPFARAARPAGEWNSMRIMAQGRSLIVFLNDVKIVQAHLGDLLKAQSTHARDYTFHAISPGAADTSEAAQMFQVRALKEERGHLGLQSWGGRVEFRDIVIRD